MTNELDWVPVEYHTITEQERQENNYPADWVYLIDSPMPEENQEILITTKTGCVEKCTCLNDGEGYYTDDDYDWCGEILAWTPLPEPYKPYTEKFPCVLGQPAEIFFEGEWVRGKIVDGYRFRDGIVTIETDEGKRIWCGQSRTDLYREVEENDE